MGTSRRGDFDEALNSVDERWDTTGDDTHNLTSRERIRKQLDDDVAAFLSKGGQIQHLDTSMHAENYTEQVGDSDLF